MTGGLLTAIGINTLAPAWAPALIPQPPTVAREVVQRLLDAPPPTNSARSAAQVRLELLGGQTFDARRTMSEVDARLQQIDRRTGAASGTTRAAALEVALGAAGVDRDLAAAVAHGSTRTEVVARGVVAMERAVHDGKLDPAVLLLGGADLLDRLSSDGRLEAAFVVGFALAPHLNDSTRAFAENAVSAGRAGLSAWQRHHQAVQALKHPGTDNAFVNGAGFAAGTAVEVLGAGLSFFGPGPLLGLARGGEPVLVLAQFLAAKTAVAGTAKTVATYTSIPEDAAALVAGFLAGAASHATVDDAEAEARATVAHVRASSHNLKAALDAGDLNAVHAALTDAVATSTPSEKALWAQVLRTVVEHAAVGG